MKWSPKILEMGHFETAEEFIIPLTESIRPHSLTTPIYYSHTTAYLSHTSRELTPQRNIAKLLTSVALSNAKQTLCYGHHCYKTTMAVVERLGLPPEGWSLSYQSRLGPVKWLEPSTTQMVENLVKKGIKISLSWHRLFLGWFGNSRRVRYWYPEEFMEHGGLELKVINCLNDDQQWVQGLEQLISKEFERIAA